MTRAVQKGAEAALKMGTRRYLLKNFVTRQTAYWEVTECIPYKVGFVLWGYSMAGGIYVPWTRGRVEIPPRESCGAVVAPPDKPATKEEIGAIVDKLQGRPLIITDEGSGESAFVLSCAPNCGIATDAPTKDGRIARMKALIDIFIHYRTFGGFSKDTLDKLAQAKNRRLLLGSKG